MACTSNRSIPRAWQRRLGWVPKCIKKPDLPFAPLGGLAKFLPTFHRVSALQHLIDRLLYTGVILDKSCRGPTRQPLLTLFNKAHRCFTQTNQMSTGLRLVCLPTHCTRPWVKPPSAWHSLYLNARLWMSFGAILRNFETPLTFIP